MPDCRGWPKLLPMGESGSFALPGIRPETVVCPPGENRGAIQHGHAPTIWDAPDYRRWLSRGGYFWIPLIGKNPLSSFLPYHDICAMFVAKHEPAMSDVRRRRQPDDIGQNQPWALTAARRPPDARPVPGVPPPCPRYPRSARTQHPCRNAKRSFVATIRLNRVTFRAGSNQCVKACATAGIDLPASTNTGRVGPAPAARGAPCKSRPASRSS